MLFRVARSREGGGVTHYDESLSFRYSCRGAVCGSCAMLIDKVPRLACRTQTSTVKDDKVNMREPFDALISKPQGWDPANEILVEPLPNLPILKDLVVDMMKFYDALETLKLWGIPSEGDNQRLQSPADRKGIERYVNCIMCALCFGSCPINAREDAYLGPAALAKSWRFHEDTRVEQPTNYLEAAKIPSGSPLCDLIYNCVRVCPKGVAPGGAIRKIKES
jgi:succinate dehydrogenase / fumarate reductase iron-sulfur subunit